MGSNRACKFELVAYLSPLLAAAALLVHPGSQARAQSPNCAVGTSLVTIPSAGFDCATGVLGGETLDVAVTIGNESATLPPGPTPVDAILTAGAVITVSLPAGDSFVSAGANGCARQSPPNAWLCLGR